MNLRIFDDILTIPEELFESLPIVETHIPGDLDPEFLLLVEDPESMEAILGVPGLQVGFYVVQQE
jgi:hypothetical protein